MMNKTKKAAAIGLGVALSMIFSYIEYLLPPISVYVPGIKMGLGNIVMLFFIYRIGIKEGVFVTVIRLLLSSLLFGTAVSLIYGTSGAVLALGLTIILKKTNKFSPIGVSVGGAVAHNAGQIIAAIFLLGTAKIGYYFAVLILTGTISGIIVGTAAGIIIKGIKKIP